MDSVGGFHSVPCSSVGSKPNGRTISTGRPVFLLSSKVRPVVGMVVSLPELDEDPNILSGLGLQI